MRTHWIAVILGALTAGVFIAGVANAHVTVWPRESAAGASDLYTLRVPSERDVPTISVRVEFPPAATVSRFAPSPGWQRQVDRDSAGRITAVSWSGGQIAADEIGLFQFTARNASTPGAIAWKAYQTYADGSVVEWTGPEGSPTPASVTQLTAPPMSPSAATQAIAVGHVIAAIALLDASEFHALAEAVKAGTIPAGSLGKVHRARLVAAATTWPETLREAAHKLVQELGHLYQAIETGNAAGAAEPAHEVHEVEHDLSKAVYAWLAERAGLALGEPGHAD